MQILTFAEQTPTKLPLFGLEWGNEANGDFLFALTSFSLVVVTLNLAVTMRVGATFKRKNNLLLVALPNNSRLRATLYGKKIFFKGLTNQ